jgi:hypothetical protein
MSLRSSWMVVASAPLGHNFDSGRPECANTGHSPRPWRMGQIDPLMPFKIDPMNGR